VEKKIIGIVSLVDQCLYVACHYFLQNRESVHQFSSMLPYDLQLKLKKSPKCDECGVPYFWHFATTVVDIKTIPYEMKLCPQCDKKYNKKKTTQKTKNKNPK